jgi:alpha-galactosidase
MNDHNFKATDYQKGPGQVFVLMRYFCPFFLFTLGCCYANAQPVAQTQPIGWNSYNCFGSAVHEDEVKANAEYVS